jgi:hypothetical protein
MNTCLSALYFKLTKIDSRYIRLAFMLLAVVASRSVVLGLPIHGEVGG